MRYQASLRGMAVEDDGFIVKDGQVYGYQKGNYEEGSRLDPVEGTLIEVGEPGQYQMFFNIYYEADTIEEISAWVTHVAYPVEFVLIGLDIKETT